MTGVHPVHVLLQRGQIRRVVLGGQGRPDSLHDLPAQVLEHALEPRVGLPAERVIHADGGHAAQVELLVGIVPERKGELTARRGRPQDPPARLALGDVVGRHHRIDGRDLVLLEVGGDGIAGGGEQPARDRVHLLLLDQSADLGDGARRLRIGVLHEHLDLAARHLVANLLPEEVEAVRHVLARLGEVAREGSEESDADGPAGRAGEQGPAGQPRSDRTQPGEERAPLHWFSSSFRHQRGSYGLVARYCGGRRAFVTCSNA